MKRTNKKPLAKLLPAGVAVLTIAVTAFAIHTNAAQTVAGSDLSTLTHIHGLAVDRQDPLRQRRDPDAFSQRNLS
jgi:hypothetical protein